MLVTFSSHVDSINLGLLCERRRNRTWQFNFGLERSNTLSSLHLGALPESIFEGQNAICQVSIRCVEQLRLHDVIATGGELRLESTRKTNVCLTDRERRISTPMNAANLLIRIQFNLLAHSVTLLVIP
jgi:hypothetical protein